MITAEPGPSHVELVIDDAITLYLDSPDIDSGYRAQRMPKKWYDFDDPMLFESVVEFARKLLSRLKDGWWRNSG